MERFRWQGVTVQVSYEADWMGMSERHSQFAIAHLEIEAGEPRRQALPITETGYRSNFIARGIVEQEGGPLAYARAWLDHAAKAPAWKRQQGRLATTVPVLKTRRQALPLLLVTLPPQRATAAPLSL